MVVVVAPWTLAVTRSDVPVLVLVLGVLVLCATTVVMALNLPSRRWARNGWVVERRQQPRRANDRRGTHRNPDVDEVTTIRLAGRDHDGGLFALLAASHPIRSTASLDDPEGVIIELLDTNPELLARVMSEWIRNDERDGPTP